MTALSAVLMSPAPASADPAQAFSRVFTANTNGAIVIRGNSLMSCESRDPVCENVRDRTADPTRISNNAHQMAFVDSDADSSTFNSSSSAVQLPGKSTVLFAGLYWSGDTAPGTAAAPDATARNTMRLSVPGGPYHTVTADRFDEANTTQNEVYQGFADVTALVEQAGSGSYTGANVQSAPGYDRYAGWALVVVYEDATEPIRNLAVFDGFSVVRGGATPADGVRLQISGFHTPPTGEVKSHIGGVVYEGDATPSGGDQMLVNSTPITTGGDSVDNAFASYARELTSEYPGRVPSYSNMMGMDVFQTDTQGTIGNQENSAVIDMKTSSDTFYTGVLTLATELSVPQLDVTKRRVGASGVNAKPGDEIDYEINIRNSGSDAAVDSVLSDAVPRYAHYVPGSASINGTALTDARGDDEGDFHAVGDRGRLILRVGGGASATEGGRLPAEGRATARFRVRVDDDAPHAVDINNAAAVGYTGELTGREFSATSNTVRVTVSAPSVDPSSPSATPSPAPSSPPGPTSAPPPGPTSAPPPGLPSASAPGLPPRGTDGRTVAPPGATSPATSPVVTPPTADASTPPQPTQPPPSKDGADAGAGLSSEAGSGATPGKHLPIEPIGSAQFILLLAVPGIVVLLLLFARWGNNRRHD
ncbi:hypothetical protein ACIBKX_40455 [Streptomyces sp. NPDC050658]|uniref:hypothetical protein n=1 Tax=unclassified Streptomyces TaxID=2593676 RepID=UPI00341CE3AC